VNPYCERQKMSMMSCKRLFLLHHLRMHEKSYTDPLVPLSIDPKANQSRHASADFR